MNIFSKYSAAMLSIVSLVIGLSGPIDALAAGPATVNLLSAGNFTILSKAGITNTGSHTSAITGDIASSPITAAGMNNVFCSEVTGKIYGVDAAYVGSGSQTCFSGNPGVPAVIPPDANKTLANNAVLDMATAYNDAAGKTNPTATGLGAGNISGMTLAPGLYKWGTDVNVLANVTLAGSANDTWIFQIAGNLNVASAGSVATGIKVILSGGASASNIFWQVGGVTGATLGTYSTFNGTILSAKQIILQTGAVLNGRALAQTQVTLDASTVSAPAGAAPVASVPVAPVTPAVITPPTTPSGSSAGSAGNPGLAAPTPTLTVTPVLQTLTRVQFRAAIAVAIKNFLTSIKANLATFQPAMKKAITDGSVTEKRTARQAFTNANKVAEQTFSDAKAAARSAWKQ